MKNKKDSIVIGTGGHSRAVISLLKKQKNYIINSLIEISSNINLEERVLDCPVIGGIEYLENLLKDKSYCYFIAVGDNSIRKKFFDYLTQHQANLPNLYDPYCFVDKDIKLGNGNIFLHNSFVGPSVSLGSNNIFNTGSVMEHDSIIGSHCHLAPNSVVCGNSSIADLCSMGANSTIIEKISISSNVCIGAGSTVVKSIKKSFSTYVGSPAKEIKKKK